MPDQEELVQVDFFTRLVETRKVDPTRVSCIATALREARGLVGRSPSDGRVVAAEHGGTWAGALVYLIYCEQIGSCFRPRDHPQSRRRGKAVADALVWFGGFGVADSEVLEELRNRLAHDYTLRSRHPRGIVFGLHGGVQEPVVQRFGQEILVGLPALAHRIETTFNLSLLLLVERGDLICHHPDGLAGVQKRFWMAIIGPDSDNAGRASGR